MRWLWIVVAVGVLAMFGDFTYRTFLRPIDPPTEGMRALASHFHSEGIGGRLYPVRHGFRHSRVIAAGAFEVENFPLPIGLIECATDAEASRLSARRPDLPESLQPVRNGRLVMDFPGWGDDGGGMAGRLARAFTSYRRM
ncbi:hypothetical protein LVB87_12990 [Lysobacter sp. KIS68-7]|uniref:hypothetical protein n=1 Tax=Lysobacter sp. KIS68-7 TaxID=2904252 RepID=UPI001E33D95E|nr:hypothetical protein [Lysobacter sp. KIS68-7]UHQ19090.1 hypothetical protein LVB87_12990 [Lysobacter sp. KIS68-7]